MASKRFEANRAKLKDERKRNREAEERKFGLTPEPDWDLVRRACDAVYNGTKL